MNEVVNSLFSWFRENARDLPWRNTSNPYHIWVSEIVLQQTRVDQGRPYYEKIILEFPDFCSLAAASEDHFLKFWQGLGYYSRARNMKKAALTVCEKFNGELPGDYDKILGLPGIGRYTAAAISSFAFNLPYPAVDGNVRRVAARLVGIQEPTGSKIADEKTEKFLREIIPVSDPGTFNQAMIELGALVCTPARPACDACPLSRFCFAFQHKKQNEFPVVTKKKKPVNLNLNFYFVQQGEFTWVVKRDNSGIWKGLYEFPCFEGDEQPPDFFAEGLTHSGNALLKSRIELKHQLTHRTIFARFWHFCLPESIIVHPNDCMKIKLEELNKLPVHRLMHRYMEQNEILREL